MKKSYFLHTAILLIALLWGATPGWADTYTKITTLDELTDGKYVIAYGDTYAMKNEKNGTRIVATTITVSDNSILNPDASIVWDITTTENGKSIVKNLLIQMSLTAQLIDNGVFETTRVTVHNFSNVILGIGNRISTIPVIQFVLHQPDLLALGHRRLCIPAVDLAQVLQPDAVHLRNAVQRLARFSHMNHLPVRTAFTLGPDIKHIAGLHRRIRLQIVVTGQLLDRHTCFRCNALRSVSVLNYDEQAAVIPVYGVFAVLS